MKELFKKYAELKLQKESIEKELKDLLPVLLEYNQDEFVVDNYILTKSGIPKYELAVEPEVVKQKYADEYNKSLVLHTPTLRKLVDDTELFNKVTYRGYKVKSLAPIKIEGM